MRVVFAGTPAFAARALEALLAAGHEIPLVLTQPDRPAGRGLRLAASPVSDWASQRGIALHKPVNLRTEEAREPIRKAKPDVVVVAAYGLILPQAVLDIPSGGCLNIHASLLPRWRGAAPIQRALLAGDTRTGVGIMRMEAGLDTGPVLLEKVIDIEPRETSGSLTERLAELGANAIVQALANLSRLAPRTQDEATATYASKITKGEARINWSQSAEIIDRQIRAYNPFPGAETVQGGLPLKIWTASPVEGMGSPGTVLAASPVELRVACGSGALAIEQVQRAGSRRMAVSEYLRGTPLEPGSRLGDVEKP
ncbi:methionyl-tRNA formyltransferase [Usitatibacter palustris]|uniref:Methionyl-tRNA formyltransferase n=1 Tax=Usitatibacter palustris TaxID=2732487 RepID=A0A6M4H156_9PROT|nr:methionyl-tRNA formyltransferase [Usitatibacter palustris]QJR13226.1 Methionyl-tRNA formyltransferase [Usitatibacter palustris]